MKVEWNYAACCHSTKCVTTLPEVFKVVDGHFLIHPDAAPEEAVRAVVHNCPSQALKIVD